MEAEYDDDDDDDDDVEEIEEDDVVVLDMHDEGEGDDRSIEEEEEGAPSYQYLYTPTSPSFSLLFHFPLLTPLSYICPSLILSSHDLHSSFPYGDLPAFPTFKCPLYHLRF